MPFAAPRQWDFFPGFRTLNAVFDGAECQRIIELHKGRKPETSNIEGKTGNYRSSDLFWLKPEQGGVPWIYERLKEVCLAFNRETFDFELDGCMDLQLTRYGKDQHYGWHADLAGKRYSRRKLSISVQLSPPGDFDGGDLQFFESDTNMPTVDLAPGDAVLFPSWYKHRILPVSRGERWSLVGWWTGPPFR